ncbi:MAG TPA: TspO/MBR family protein [Gemmatimonadaceae bacterium]|nr:TspO/MBR family protein [Gemmatimonadaceae bacterium]
MVKASAPGSIVALAAFGSLVAGAAIYGARFTPQKGRTRAWYRRLEKPPFNPPQAVFPPVWTALYVLIALSGWRVWRSPLGRKRNASLALWGGQLIANAAWSKLFFGDRRPRAALADIVALLAGIATYTAVTSDVDRRAAAMMIPYGAWVSFAALLNEEIVRRNPRDRAPD